MGYPGALDSARVRRVLFVGFLILFSGCLGRESVPDVGAPLKVALESVATDLMQPVHVWHSASQPERLFVVEQVGRIVRMQQDGSERHTFLDIQDRVGSGGERGLFTLAFDPDIEDRVYVHYTDKEGDTVVSWFRHDGESADEGSESVLLRQEQPYPNHNGGQIAFGPDGHFYIGLGDGGSSGDPHANGQKLSTWLGKILRIDPNESEGYTVPDDNPFREDADAKPEIWAYGLRNPWRFSFDRETGDLFIGDVGQNQWEEIDHIKQDVEGANFGWNRFEGRHPFRGGSSIEHVEPIHEYATGPGGTCAVTGGYVYRGDALPALKGVYVFADYCGGTIWGLVPGDGGWSLAELLRTEHKISSFGEDADGEVYVANIGGSVHRLVEG